MANQSSLTPLVAIGPEIKIGVFTLTPNIQILPNIRLLAHKTDWRQKDFGIADHQTMVNTADICC